MFRFTLRQLRVFTAAARHLSYTRAADELHLTQPAVSMQIRQLEENAGVPLFEQIGRQLELTDGGRVLYSYAQKMNELIVEMDEVLKDMRGLRRGHLKVSVASTANYFVTRMLAEFSKLYPEISISLDVTNREALLRQLKENETDIVIMGEPPADMDLVSEAFMDNPLVVISAVDHPLAGQRQIPLKVLAEQRFVLREPGSGTHGAITRFFNKRGLQLHTGLEMRSNEAIKQAVEAGLGLGIVSLHTLELELETGRIAILDAEDMPIRRHWYMVHRQGKRDTPVMRSFHDYVLAEAHHHIRLPEGVEEDMLAGVETV